MISKSIILCISVVLVGSVLFVLPRGNSEHSSSNESRESPVGTFDLTVTASGQPPFKELLVLHSGGTVSETNTATAIRFISRTAF